MVKQVSLVESRRGGLKVITLKEISFSYPNQERRIIHNVTVSIKQGEFVALIGPNGSGKSTLAKLMNGLLQPTEGEIWINSLQPTDEEQIWQIRQKVGMVFQNPENQFVATTVLDDVAFGLENIGYPPEQMQARIEEALRRVNMWEFRDVEPHHLSGGQKQRVAIAGILAMKPDVIIFDEATSMLDPQGRNEIVTIMQELHQEGITIITITHDMDEAWQASRVILMNEGSIQQDTDPHTLFEELPLLIENNLELPFVLMMREGLKEHGIELPNTIQNKKDLVEHLWTLLSKT